MKPWFADFEGAEEFLVRTNNGLQAWLDNGAAPVASEQRDAEQVLEEWIAEEKRGSLGALRTGWDSIDRGMEKLPRRGEVVVVAARTGVGKTWSLLSMIDATLRDSLDSACLLVSLEMGSAMIGSRVAARILGESPATANALAADGSVTAPSVLTGGQWWRRMILEEAPTIRATDLPGLIEHASGILGMPITVVAIDYLGLLKRSGPRMPRHEAVAQDIRDLQEVARSCSVVVLTAAQLARSSEQSSKGNWRQPSLDSIAESGAVENGAARVLILYKHPDDPSYERTIVLAKNRLGAAGARAQLRFDASMRMREVAYTPPPPPADEFRKEFG